MFLNEIRLKPSIIQINYELFIGKIWLYKSISKSMSTGKFTN